MTHLSLHGGKVETVFHLIGNNENALTKSLGWCLSQAPSFLDCLGSVLGTPDLSARNATIKLQEYQPETGITDLEIYARGYAAWIIEAKRGFTVPSMDQLRKYAERLTQLEDRDAVRGLVVLAASDRKNKWLSQRLPAEIDHIPIRSLSWRDVQGMAGQARSGVGPIRKSLLGQFQIYLDSEAEMQNQNSNWVYVVSLSYENFGGVTSFVDVVKRYRKYFHPVGGDRSGWPIEPPNYLAFRYDGHLQSIHHVDDYEMTTNLGPFFPDQPSEEQKPLFLYHLGPPICPAKPTPTGAPLQAARRWCYIDLLLTSNTIAEALSATKERERVLQGEG